VRAETIRPCRAGDVGAVLDLWGVARSEHAVTEDAPERVARLIEFDALLVAELDGAVVGTVIAAFDGWRGNFYRLAVAPAFRRRGIAARLVATGAPPGREMVALSTLFRPGRVFAPARTATSMPKFARHTATAAVAAGPSSLSSSAVSAPFRPATLKSSPKRRHRSPVRVCISSTNSASPG
jgi:GNAT superfamily N-acetyltransferase